MNTERTLSAVDDPVNAGQMAQEILEAANQQPIPAEDEGPAIPEAPAATSLEVELPGGLDHPTKGLVRRVLVKELNGLDEERLSRLAASEMWRFKPLLLELGTVEIGDDPATPELLNLLTIGDREFLVLQIRRATYGDDLEMEVTCPVCANDQQVVYSLVDDVPMRGMDSPTFDVELRGGRRATLQIPTGREEIESLKMAARGDSSATINTMLIGSCMAHLDGVMWLGEQSARELGMGDRSAILSRLADVQPGPRFEEVTHVCNNCGEERPLVIGLADLFR